MQTQQHQESEVAELRARSAKLLESWINTGVVATGERWADWEARVRDVTRTVSILERRMREDGE